MNKKKIIFIILAIVVALLSFFVLSNYFTSIETHAESIAYLDNKKEQVLSLTALSAASSALLSLLPGDAGSPIATQLIGFSEEFVLLTAAICLEKYLLTLTSFLSFKFLIPLSCVGFIYSLLKGNKMVFSVSSRLALFSILIVCVIPTSVQVSKMIESTYDNTVQNNITELQQSISENDTTKIEEDSDSSFLDKLINTGKQITNSISNGVSDSLAYVNTYMSNFVDAVSVMIITCCVIPILVFFLFLYLAKLLLKLDISIPSISSIHHSIHKKNEKMIQE